jgi:ectoine hydroxylase-related dioxygenase (phytanoyl-CoA dioxygenase family)
MFEQAGYEVFDNVFSQEDLDSLQKAADRLIKAKVKGLIKKPEVFFDSHDIQKFIDCSLTMLSRESRGEFDEFLDRLSSTLEFNRLISTSKIEECVNHCFGNADDVTLSALLSKVRILMPNTNLGRLGWHREIFQTVPRSRFVQIWAPIFYPASPDNGSLQILEGSHHALLPKPDWKQNKNGVSNLTYADEIADQFDVTTISLYPGQAIMFDGRLIHRSGLNASSLPRYSIVGLFHDAEDPNFLSPKIKIQYRAETPLDYYETLPNQF